MRCRLPELAALLWLAACRAMAQSAEILPELVILAERGDSGSGAVPVLAEWGSVEITKSAPRTIDELLAGDPSFSLYRRQSAMFGNPTSAGVSLRNTGATAASRTLVLLDGIPQNDPFGGWVYWARYEPSSLESARIVPAARAAVWGNQSPAGVIQLASRTPFDERATVRLGGGPHGTISGALAAAVANDPQTLAFSLTTSGLRSDGFHALGEAQRGSIDRRLDLEHHGAGLKLAWRPRPGLTVEPAFSHYSEERGNGTPLARNASEALDISLRVSSEGAPLSWQALAYHQRREFNQVFTSVNATRDAETLALDQFDVPGRGTGGAFTVLWKPGENWSVTAGADARRVTGETNENVGSFRRREAGGAQTTTGIFTAAGHQTADGKTRIDTSLRLDHWRLDDGRRIEDSLTTGLRLREDNQPGRDGFEPSASISAARDLTESLDVWLSAGTGFRLPALNELHRPFRVRNDIVEANPALDPERFISLEGGLEWQAGDSLKLRAALFHHWIKDAIANVPLTDPALIAEIAGSVPPGGSVSQRQNVDEARVLGLQGAIEWQPREYLALAVSCIRTGTEFSRSSRQPLLEGKPFPQAPDLRLNGTAIWRMTEAMTVFAGCEYGSSQFDDALARRKIPDYTSVRIGFSIETGATTYHARIDNLLDAEIVTGRSSDGLDTLASPRALWLGVEHRF